MSGGATAAVNAVHHGTLNAAATATTSHHHQAHLVDEFIVHRTDKTVRLELYTEFIKLYYLNTTNIKQQNGNAATTTTTGTLGTSSAEVADLILNLKDVAGSSVGRGKEDTDVKSYFTIYAYIRPKQSSSKEISAVKRKRKTFEFEFGRMATYDENFLHVNKWHLKLYNLLRLKTFIHQQRLLNETMATTTTVAATVPTTSEAAAASSTHREIVLAKPFLVFVNPKSGSGKAKNIYFERALPVWAEANIPDTAVFTRKLSISLSLTQSRSSVFIFSFAIIS